MIRLSKKIINKNDLYEFFNKEYVAKIEIKKHDNKNLKDINVCKIYTFIYIKNKCDINTILGCCEKFSELKIPYLTGIVHQKREGWLSTTMLKKLMDIEDKYNIQLSIPKYIKEIVNNDLFNKK